MTENVVRIKRKLRPLRKTYRPLVPYVVHRDDNEDGSISYDVYDERPESYRFVCGVYDDMDNGYAKHDADQIARGLNLLVQYGMETLPKPRSGSEPVDAPLRHVTWYCDRCGVEVSDVRCKYCGKAEHETS